MTRFQNPSDGISQEALAGLMAEAVRQALMQHGVMLDAEALTSASKIAGHVAAALPFLPPAQRLAIGSFKGEWTDLASDFLRVMTEKATSDGAAISDRAFERSPPKSETGRPTAQPIAKRAADLQSMLIEDWAGEVAGSTYLEERLRIPRSTLHRWQRRGEVVALRKGGRKHVFPLAQFVDGRPVPGISEVLSAIANPRLAWFWLSRPSPELDGRVPIEMLRDDMVEDVVRAARGLS
ncbi:antitoxin Xre/MbcA/ParS toxin-binding domain-containing protein [Mesorhizobium sp. B2-8-5]|uniref:antitoxin Xre/MbcA/ParS-like domain-containing protein n=1 Tax=Mesorhizobium sp. B2-8-5 TaxID=2589903 RepID=UPI00112E6FC4|nr:antitoxin Xre/MbcA/ParS toxin-binding domain-containing protein [Mesorhizobium sp. B2-8-5]UCI26194.1 MbcA/ParS/Xre antitoxin family protein [Mesorhizobium sp. B2-8-5]